MKNSLLNVPSDQVQCAKGSSDQVPSDQVQCTKLYAPSEEQRSRIPLLYPCYTSVRTLRYAAGGDVLEKKQVLSADSSKKEQAEDKATLGRGWLKNLRITYESHTNHIRSTAAWRYVACIVAVLCLSVGEAWADTTLFNVDFTDETTEEISTSNSSATFVSKTYDGYSMSFGVKSGKSINITNNTGLVFSNDNYNSYQCLAIPLTLTKDNKVTVVVTLADDKKIKYGWVTGSLPSTPSAPSGTTYSTNSSTNTIEYTPTSAGDYVLYLGRSGSSSGKTVKSIVITQAVPAASDSYAIHIGKNNDNYTDESLTNSSGTWSKSVTLDAGSYYEFKVKKTPASGEATCYGNNGSILNTTATAWDFNTSDGNCKLYTSVSGSYTFSWDAANSKLTVTYPTGDHPTKRVYMACGSTWCESSPKFFVHSWGVSEYNTEVQQTACGDYYADIIWYNDYFQFTRNSSNATAYDNNQWNVSQNLTYNSSETKWTCTGWQDSKGTFSSSAYSSTTYSISFEGNDNTGGSMTNVSGISCGGSSTLAANGFTKTGYTFAGWKTDVAVTANGSAVAANGIVAGGATISNISSNITLTAQWDEVTCPTSGSVYSLSSPTGNYANNTAGETAITGITQSGGTAYGYGTSDKSIQITSSKIKYNGGVNYIKIALDCPLQAGDIISVTCDANTGLNFNTSSSSGLGGSSSPTEYAINGSTYTVVEGDAIVGTSTIYCWRRTSNGTNVTAITITRPEPCNDVSAPTSLTCSTQTQTSLTYTWTKASHASGYTASLWDNSSCTGTAVSTQDLDDVATVTFSSLTVGTTYYCKVQSKGDGTTYCAAGGTTAAQSGTTSACTPITPTWDYPFTQIAVGITPTNTVGDNTGSGTVSLTSSNTSYLDPSNSYTAKAAGTATLTATVAASGVYCSGSVTSPTITVVENQTGLIKQSLPTGNVAWNNNSGPAAPTTTDATNITSTTAIAATGITISTSSNNGNTNNGGQTAKIPTESSYDATKYLSLGFTVNSDHQLNVSAIYIPVQPVTSNTNSFKAELSDGTTTITGTVSNIPNGKLDYIRFQSYGTLQGNVTLKIYAWGWTAGYRLGKSIVIDGTIESTCTAPTAVNVTGNYHVYPGETISLTATSTGGTGTASYQWQKYNFSTSEWENIGTNSATYTKASCAVADAGRYRCTVSTGVDCSLSSDNFDVKMMQFYLKNSSGTDISNAPLTKGADANHASIMLNLTGGTTYNFRVTDGCNNWYGNSDATGMTSSNCTNWTMPHDADAKMTTGLKTANYTFNFDFTDGLLGSQMKVSVVYPGGNQAADKVIYWDNSVLNWSAGSQWYRIGKSDHHNKTQMTLVSGTANLYKVTTTEYNGFEYWHIANNEGQGTGNLFWTKDNASTGKEITHAMAFEGAPVTADAVTITPTTSYALGETTDNNNCYFYTYGMTNGMKSWVLTVSDPGSHGTLAVNYNDINGTAQVINGAGSATLAHTCICTPTAVGLTGYDVASLTVNGSPHTNRENFILTSTTTVAATFSPINYTITYNLNGGSNHDDNPATYTIESSTITLQAPTKTGSVFAGWYSNSSFTGDPVTSIAAGSTGNVTLWAKWDTPLISWDLKVNANWVDVTGTTTDGTNISSIVTSTANTTVTNDNKADKTSKLALSSSATPDKYVEFKFNVACGKKLTPSSIKMKVLNVGGSSGGKMTHKAELTDYFGHSISGTVQPASDGNLTDLVVSNASGTYFQGLVSLKVWAWNHTGTSGSAFRMGQDVDIYGTIATESTPAATITWDTQPANGQVGDADATIAAHASDGSTVTFTSNNTSVATIVNGKVHYVGAGTTTIQASITDQCSNNVTLNSNSFTVTAPVLYTVTYNYNSATGGNGTASATQSTEGGSITLPTPTRTNHVFDGWYTSGGTKAGVGGGSYTPTADITLNAQWKATCSAAGSGGGGGATLFSQNFYSATAVAYDAPTNTTAKSLLYNSSNTLSGLVGNGANLFTSIATSIKKGDIAINSSTGGNSVDATGFFQAYCMGDNTAYWSITRTTDFAATAPTALKVTMDIWYNNGSSGSSPGVQFAIGDGFTDGLKSTSAQNSSVVHSGFGIYANSTAKLTQYNSTTAIYNTGIKQSTWLSVTWIINNTGSSLTYDNPTGSGTTTLDDDKFDVWLKTQAGVASTYTKVVSAQSATTPAKDLQNIYIGYNYSGKIHEFRLDNVNVYDLTPATSGDCYYVTYNGNGATGGFVNDVTAYESGQSATVLANAFTRTDGYSFTGWNTAADGSGTDYAAGNTITMDDDVTLYAQWVMGDKWILTAAVNEDGWGTVSPASIAVAKNASITTSSNVVTCDGQTLTATAAAATDEYTYAFSSWTNASGTATANQTITANFTRTANSYTLAWSTDGGSALAGSYTSGTVAFGTTLTKPTEPTKAGYVFGGWSDGAGNTYLTADAMTMPAKNVTYTAVWDAEECDPTTLFSFNCVATSEKTYNVRINNTTSDVAIPATDATVTGGTAYAGTNSTSQNISVKMANSSGYKYKFDANTTYMKIVLSEALTEGDIIAVTANYKVSFTTTATRSTTYITSSGTFEVPAALAGVTTLYLWRGEGSTTYMQSITITRPCDEGECVTPNLTISTSSISMSTSETKYIDVTVNNAAAIEAAGGSLAYAWTNNDNSAISLSGVSGTTGSRLTIASPTVAGTYTFKCIVTNTCSADEDRSAEVSCTVTVTSGGCTEIAKVIVSGTSTGTASGSKIDDPGYNINLENSTNTYSSKKGYKIGSGKYISLTLQDGEQFQNGDVVKVYVTKVCDLSGSDKKVHIYIGTTSAGTEIGTSASAATQGDNSVTLSNVPSGTRSITIHRGSGTKEQNHYIYSVTVERCNDCTPARYTGLDYDADKTTVAVNGEITSIAVLGAEGVDSYQWKYSANSDRSSATTIAGATSSSYTPSSETRHDTRYYWCELTNDCGTVQTATVAITVTNSLSTPTVSWTDTYESPVYGGEGFAIKATVGPTGWDGTLTTNMLVAPAGVVLSNVTVSGKVIQGTYGVTSAATSPIIFTLSLPETTNYSSLDATKEITFTKCTESAGTEYNVRVRKTAVHINNKYYWETENVGLISIGGGGNSINSTKSGTTMATVFDSIYNSNSQEVLVSPYVAGIKTIRVYAQFRDKNITVAGVSKHNTFSSYSSSNAVAYSVKYNGSDSAEDTGDDADVFRYVDITLEELLAVNDFIAIKFSTAKARPLGAKLIAQGAVSGSSSITTTLQWATTPAAIVEKPENADVFTYAANIKADEGAATLSKVTYSSSDPAVATVNSSGAVTISAIEWADNEDENAYRECDIKATLPASGCYKKSELSYTLRVTRINCGDLKGTITVTEAEGLDIAGDVVTNGECTNVTMTVSGYTEGASIQWYKDGSPISGKTTASITVTAAGVYRAQTHLTCDRKSTNSVTITTVPMSVSKIVDEWYIKQGRETPDIALFQVTGATSFTVNNAASGGSNITSIAGAQFEMRNGIIYLKGTAPTGISTAANETIRVVLSNGCTSLDNSGAIIIHKQVETAKPSLAFVVNGKGGGGWTESITAAQTTNVGLYNKISEQFDVTAVNAYAKTDEKLIKQYYSQYDIVCITDYPDTQNKGSGKKSYVNSLGAIIDIRPLLTMEAFVSKLSNWSAKGMTGTPKSPTNRQYNMILQCENHEIFSGTNFENIGDEVYRVNVVDSTLADFSTYDATSKSYKASDYPALQGFPLFERDNEKLPIGKINNGTTQLQAGMERQVEMAARTMVLGINSKAMERLSADGERIVINALNYLLKKDEEEIADCSNYFLGTTSNDWSNTANWLYNRLPTKDEEARILAPCVLSGSQEIMSLNIVSSGTSKHKAQCNGSLTIEPQGALIVNDLTAKSVAPKYRTTSSLISDNLLIRSSASHVGAFIYNDETGLTGATVELYSKSANNTGGNTTTWQYVGVPITTIDRAESYFYGAWMCSWENGGWRYISVNEPVAPFKGYALTQPGTTSYYLPGLLSAATHMDISLDNTGSTYTGFNLVANSWTAPIQISQFKSSDFGSGATQTIYIYNTGTYDQWSQADNTATTSLKTSTTAGQYVAIPINAASTIGYKVIPPMQAFFIKTSSATTLTLDYDYIVKTNKANVTTDPLRTPRRDRQSETENIMLTTIMLEGETSGDIVHLLTGDNDEFTNGFDNGWDAEKLEASESLPMLSVVGEDADYAVSSQPELDGTTIKFHAGSEDEIYDLIITTQQTGLELYDMVSNVSIPLIDTTFYTFNSTNRVTHPRFVIRHKQGMTTQVENNSSYINAYAQGDKICLTNNSNQRTAANVYDATGKLVQSLILEAQSKAVVSTPAAQGIYIVRLTNTEQSQTVKIIF